MEALLLASLGRLDAAFETLDRALEERDSSLLYLPAVPKELGLPEDPRYQEVRRRMGVDR